MININNFYKSILDFLNKNNGQYISPDEFNRITNLASMDYFNEVVGNKTNSAVVYGKNRILDRRLNPFKKSVTIPVVNGEAVKPTNMEFMRMVYVTVAGKPVAVRQVEESRFARTFDNPLASGIAEDPILLENELTLSLYPQTITSIKLDHIVKPTDAKWAYTLPNGRRPAYDLVNSVNLDWDISEEPQLIMRVLNYLGLNNRDQAVVQFSEKEKVQQK